MFNVKFRAAIYPILPDNYSFSQIGKSITCEFIRLWIYLKMLLSKISILYRQGRIYPLLLNTNKLYIQTIAEHLNIN